MSRTVVAELPRMKCSDLKRFEQEGGVWGQQYGIRKKQVATSLAGTATSILLGGSWIKFCRHNTWIVVGGTMPLFALFGAFIGHAAGVSMFPSIANNQETTMMRRTWWAKECSKSWDMKQVDGKVWKAKYPNSKLAGK